MKLAALTLTLVTATAFADLPTFDPGPRPKDFKQLRAYHAERGLTIRRKQLKTPPGVTQTNSVVYATRGDRALRIDTFVPKSVNELKTVVVLVHGGGWKKGDRSGEHTKAAWFSDRGYVAVCPEYRLSGEAKFPAAIHDVKDAVRWTRDHARDWGADPDRIVVMGFSAGAHLVALAATAGPEAQLESPSASATSSNVAASIVVAGPTDTEDEQAFKSARRPDSNYIRFLGGTPDEVRDTYRVASPAHWVGGNEPPMLFVAEGAPERYAAIRAKLDSHGVQNDILNLTGGLHSEWNWEPWFTVTMERADAFIRSTMK